MSVNPPSVESAATVARGGRRPFGYLFLTAALVLGWFLLSEGVTYFWYASHEAKASRNNVPASGEVVLERLKLRGMPGGAQSKEQEIGDAAMDMLKCSFGKTLIWSDAGSMAAVTVLRWNASSVVGGVETLHNPGVCLGAAGWKVGKRTSRGVQEYCGAFCDVTEWEVSRDGRNMRAFSAILRRFAESETANEHGFRNSERLKSVFSGRRDAPVMILLVYLPVEADEAVVYDRLQAMLRVMLCTK